jgi:replicative DNA helicase
MKIVGGHEYMQELLLAAGETILDAKDYGKNLLTLWQKRELFKAIESLDKSKTLEEIKSDLNETFDGLEFENEKQPRSANELMQNFIVRKVEQKETGEIINLGYPLLDKILSGLYCGNMITLAGKTSMGKTAFALNLAKNISQTIPTVLFSIEMTEDEVLARFLVEMASINGYRLKNGCLKPIEEQAAMIAKNDYNSRLFIDDPASITVANLESKIKRLVSKHGVKVVIIDYLQKMKPTNLKDSRERQIGGIAEDLKTLAKKYQIVVIVLCQLSRENEKRQNKRPLLSDLRDSGSIEQESDVVMFVHRDDYYLEKEAEPPHSPNYNRWLEAYQRSKGKAYILIGKNRNGETGESEMKFDKEFQRFTEENNY